MDVISIIRTPRLVMAAFDANITEYSDEKMHITGSRPKVLQLNQHVVAFQTVAENADYLSYLKRLGELNPDKVIEDFVEDVQSFISHKNVDFEGMKKGFDDFLKLRAEKGDDDYETHAKFDELQANPLFQIFIGNTDVKTEDIAKKTQGVILIGRTREGLLDIMMLKIIAGAATDAQYMQASPADIPYYWCWDRNNKESVDVKKKMLQMMSILTVIASELKPQRSKKHHDMYLKLFRDTIVKDFRTYQGEDKAYRGDYHFFEIGSHTGGIVQAVDFDKLRRL